MGRSSALVAVVAVLLLAAAGLSSMAAARARSQRQTAERTQAAAAPAPAQRTAAAQAAPQLVSTTAIAQRAPAVHAARARSHRRTHSRSPGAQVLAVKSGRTVALHERPHGRVLAHVGSRTEFGSPRTLSVAARRGRWLGVTTTDAPNGRLAWVDAHAGGVTRHHTRIALVVHLARRRLDLRDGRRVLRHVRIAIGRPGSPTPRGRFQVTDKLSGSSYGSYYGCCILALSGHQPHTPAGWRGGDRLAIHGTDSPGTIGARVSAGCLHASDADLRALMRRVPLGAPVLIRA